MTVSSTDPTGAPQDTTLDVKVSGSNFDQSAWVDLALNGQATTAVRTNSTRYVNQKQLIANITIAADAEIGSYDVVVTSKIRKPGIGTEMFEVRQTGQVVNPSATFTYFDASASSTGGGVSGDGLNADGSARASGSVESVYDDGWCNVTASIYENRAGDATMDPIGTSGRSKNCRTTKARALTVRFGTPVAGASLPDAIGGHHSNVREVTGLAVGDSHERLFTLYRRGTHTCERIRYDSVTYLDETGVVVTGRPIRITRLSANEWLAESQPAATTLPDGTPNPYAGMHIAFCQVGGSGGVGDFYDPGTLLGAYDVPLRIRVVRK